MMSEITFTCTRCGQAFPTHQCYDFDDEFLCPDCYEDYTALCRDCGDRLWLVDNIGTADRPLCRDCYDDHYHTCAHCGAVIHNHDTYYLDEDDEDGYCRACYDRAARDKVIQDYYYKPEPIFYGEGPRFFGVELELDHGGEDHDNARSILDIANAEHEHAYCKHDGSLDDGFEIVTHPMSLVHQQTAMPWGDILKKAAHLGYTSHQARTCGLHVHVSRAAFGHTEEVQDLAIARALYFFEKHWEELLKFSRRTEIQLRRWAARYGYKDQPMEILDSAKRGYGSGRYSSVNLQNRETVEFRMFRGTLKLNTLIATLQLIDKICDVALFLSDEEVKALSWTSFVAGICSDKMPELVQYLKERRLYINEPVAESEGEL